MTSGSTSCRTARPTLVEEHTDLVCGMNLHLITAMLDELGQSAVQARIDPAPQRCCVRLTGAPG